jgi:hypothetical protein
VTWHDLYIPANFETPSKRRPYVRYGGVRQCFRVRSSDNVFMKWFTRVLEPIQ